MKKLGRLYAITDPVLLHRNDIFSKVELALQGGVDILQLRDKVSPKEEIFKIACELKKICDDYEVLFVINDDPELAASVNADGVHIGSEDPDFKTTKQIVGEKAIIGVSCYTEIKCGVEMATKGADYVAFGSIYPSPSKPESKTGGLIIGPQLKGKIKIPYYAIGGINHENAATILNAGYYGLAVISAIFATQDVKASAEKFSNIINQYPWRAEHE